jgi:cytochrome c553
MNKLLISLLVTFGISGVAQAAGDAAAGQANAGVCAGCHSADGNSAVPNFPKLAGQNAAYLLKQLTEIQSGSRQVVEMTGLLANFSEQDLADIAAYYASQKVQIGQTSEELVAAGQQIYRAGLMEKGVAACTACHSPNGTGNASAGFPALSGQHAAYVEKQLMAFRNGARANDPNGMMRDIAAKLSDTDIKAVADYVQGLH